MDYIKPNESWLNGYEPEKKADPKGRLTDIIAAVITVLLLLMAAITVCLLVGCATPKAVEEHHHHHYEADTAAVRAQVDRHLQSWHEQVDSSWHERISQYFTQQQSSEHQQETVTETVTESVDSLGRRIRQEQRTISRDITRELQSVEQSLTRAYESRLHSAIDSVGLVWSQRYDSLSASVSRIDSASVTKTPVGDTRPWYRRWWDALQYILIGVVLGLALWFSHRWLKKFV